MGNTEQKIFGAIYKITNLVNGKIYIGQTTGKVINRFHSHSCKGRNSVISKAIYKYGKDNFTIIELYYSFSLEDLNEKEIYFISKFNSLSNKCGYNVALGGGNKTTTPSTKAKISKAHKGKRLGWKHSEDTKKRISIGNKGKIFSQETKDKMSHSKKGRPASDFTKKRVSETHKGVPLKQEHKIKISKSLIGKNKRPKSEEEKIHMSKLMMGRKHTQESIKKMGKPQSSPVKCIESGIIYKSVKNAAEILGCSRDSIFKQLSGKLKTVRGFTFERI